MNDLSEVMTEVGRRLGGEAILELFLALPREHFVRDEAGRLEDWQVIQEAISLGERRVAVLCRLAGMGSRQ